MNVNLKSFLLITIFCLFARNLSCQTKINPGILIGKSDAIKPLLKGKNYQLQIQAYDALENMKKDALKDGVKIEVVSAYRSFDHQNKLWLKKYNGFRKRGFSVKAAVKKVTQYTAIPGTSRHHWGTEVDLRGFNKNNTSKLKNNAKSKYQDWMIDNAHKYGFYLAYTNNKFRQGYQYESWHYSYRKLAKPLLTEYLKLNISTVLKHEKIAGSTIFTTSFINKYIEKHVLGINDYLF